MLTETEARRCDYINTVAIIKFIVYVKILVPSECSISRDLNKGMCLIHCQQFEKAYMIHAFQYTVQYPK
jgi:hypothetical protein